MKIYEFDSNRVYTGSSKEVRPRDPIKPSWTHIEPPETDDYAIFDGIKWFTRDEYPQPPAREPEPEKRHITVGAFYDRFGDQKWTILSSDNLLVRSLIQDVSVRTFIDLNNPQLPSGLALLEDAGIEVDIEKLLTDPIQEIEKP